MTSVDRTPVGYQEVKEALNEGRLAIPDYEILRHELLGLEHRPGKSPDHPDGGSKDVADPVAACVGYLSEHGHYILNMPAQEIASFNQPVAEPHRPWEDVGARLSID